MMDMQEQRAAEGIASMICGRKAVYKKSPWSVQVQGFPVKKVFKSAIKSFLGFRELASGSVRTPQWMQTAALGSVLLPQLWQKDLPVPLITPHLMQTAAAESMVLPQFLQNITVPPEMWCGRKKACRGNSVLVGFQYSIRGKRFRQIISWFRSGGGVRESRGHLLQELQECPSAERGDRDRTHRNSPAF